MPRRINSPLISEHKFPDDHKHKEKEMFIKIQLFRFFSLTRARVPCIFDQIIIVIKEANFYT